jgi:hypothetical protein
VTTGIWQDYNSSVVAIIIRYYFIPVLPTDTPTNPGQTNPGQTNPGHDKPWTRKTLERTNPGHDKPWTVDSIGQGAH